MKLADLEFQDGKVETPLPETAREALLAELDGWSVEAGKMLSRTFSFDNFVDALAFTNRIGDLAENYIHHPELLLEFGKPAVKWWTHTAGGIANNDFLLARETNAAYTS